MPYIDLRVIAKFVDYSKFYKFQDSDEWPFTSALLIYNQFYSEILFEQIDFKESELLCTPYLVNWTRYTSDNIKVVEKLEISNYEMILPQLRSMSYDLRNNDYEEEERFSQIFYEGNYSVLIPDEDFFYQKIENIPISKCSHLDYDVPVGSLYFIRTRIFIEYLKLNKPDELKYDVFGKLPEFLKNPDNGGDDRFVFNRYAKMPLLKDIPKEYWFKTLP